YGLSMYTRSTLSAGTNWTISIVLSAFCSSAFSSSSLKRTYWSFANSYPFTIWSFSTTTPSRAQMYCWRRRDPQSLWIQLKEMLALESPVEYSLTGTETRPNEIVAELSGRAGMAENLG